MKEGEAIAIMGKSGCGKTTLLKLIGSLLKSTEGAVYYKGQNINKFTMAEAEAYRRNKIDFIFQDYRLLDHLSVSENIMLLCLLDHKSINKTREKMQQIGKMLDLEYHFSHYLYELSGGLKQRVAIARALMNELEIILADEPTGNLDYESAKKVMELLMQVKTDFHKTLVIVTHDKEIAVYCNRIISMQSGRVDPEIIWKSFFKK